MIEIKSDGKFPRRERFFGGFVQLMWNRITVGSYRYEDGKDVFGSKEEDFIERLKKSLRQYEVTGNLEYLIDVGNYAALEFYNSNHPEQHFKSQDQGRNSRV